MQQTPRKDYVRLHEPNPHWQRMKQILSVHPEIKQLFGPTPSTAIYAISLILLQFLLAYWAPTQAWWLFALITYFIGATINHSLYVVTHELTHNLVFTHPWQNRLFALVVNGPLFFPSAMPFFKYHMLHHTHQSEFNYDADLASKKEADWIGNSFARKALALFFFSFVQGTLRPSRLKNVKFWDTWTLLNFLTQAAWLIGLYFLFGGMGLLYLFLSTLFALGIHPMGGRWIQEHYLVKEGQETNSYYGPLNKFCFNMGYHNEHHDFMKVPWSKLPKVRAMAPEFYNNLFYYRSWLGCLKRFIFSHHTTFYDRIVRYDQKGEGNPPKQS